MENSFSQLVQLAKNQSLKLAIQDAERRNDILNSFVEALEESKEKIYQANLKDQQNAQELLRKKEITESLFQRLCLTKEKILKLASYPKTIIQLPDPIKKIQYQCELDKELGLTRYSTPLGLLLVIFESRPEVLVQISSLAIKSGNAVLLKGGSEAKNTNQVLFEVIKEVLKKFQMEGLIFLLETRYEIMQLLKEEKIDLVIPRGSNELVRFIQENTKIPVLGHADGICHIYIDEQADKNKMLPLVLDSKCQYPAVCNALETLLIHQNLDKSWVLELFRNLVQNNVELRLSKELKDLAEKESIPCSLAKKKDWKTEYTDKILSIKLVTSLQEAIDHINHYGSHHTDCIITEEKKVAEQFLWQVDSAGVFHNASTRFADGYVYGLGAEVGVSTNKLHARGPVGLEGLMTYKYILKGKGQVKASYTGEQAKNFSHKIKKS